MTSGFSIEIPKFSSTKSTADKMDKKESLLQHRGPPTLPICSKDLEVIRWDKRNGSAANGVDLEMMDTNIPVLMPAPHAPQKPQAPPGTLLPLLYISARAVSRSISPPAFLYAVNNAEPTMTWCSGPCMWQKGCSISCSRILMGFLELFSRQSPMMVSIPFVWHSLQT